MFDRHLIRDAAIAVLLAVPTLALARPQHDTPKNAPVATPMVEQAADSAMTAPERRFELSTES